MTVTALSMIGLISAGSSALSPRDGVSKRQTTSDAHKILRMTEFSPRIGCGCRNERHPRLYRGRGMNTNEKRGEARTDQVASYARFGASQRSTSATGIPLRR